MISGHFRVRCLKSGKNDSALERFSTGSMRRRSRTELLELGVPLSLLFRDLLILLLPWSSRRRRKDKDRSTQHREITFLAQGGGEGSKSTLVSY